MKLVECPACGCKFQAPNGRPAVKITVAKVLQLINEGNSVAFTANNLNVSKWTIYRLLKQRGICPKDITGRKTIKKESKIEN